MANKSVYAGDVRYLATEKVVEVLLSFIIIVISISMGIPD